MKRCEVRKNIRKNLRTDSLPEAIVHLAMSDYKKALQGKAVDGVKPEIVKAECEKFFLSEYFKILCGLDGEQVIKNIKKEVRSKNDKG